MQFLQNPAVKRLLMFAAYEKICYNIKNDPKFHQDAAYGKRIGFYRLHAEIGRGNFSLVKAGSHELTRGTD